MHQTSHRLYEQNFPQITQITQIKEQKKSVFRVAIRCAWEGDDAIAGTPWSKALIICVICVICGKQNETVKKESVLSIRNITNSLWTQTGQLFTLCNRPNDVH